MTAATNRSILAAAMSSTLTLSAGGVTIQAAASGDKPTRVSILAYTGDVMTVSGYGRIVLDLAGLELPGRIPLLADHRATIAGVVGSGSPMVKAGQLLIEGIISAAVEAGQAVIELAKSGVPLQASVGVEPFKTQAVRPGETIAVNGRSIKAVQGFTLVAAGRLRETSITPLGADGATTVSISANKGNTSMTFEQWLQANGFDPAAITDQQRATLQASYAAQQSPLVPDPAPIDPIIAERQRAAAVQAIATGYPAIAARAVADGWDENRTSREVLIELRASRTAPAAGGSSRRNVGNIEPVKLLTAAFLIHAGFESSGEKHLGADVMQSGRGLGVRSLFDLCRASLRLDGRDDSGMSQNEMIRAAISTISLPTALGDAAGKILLTAYNETKPTWQAFASIKSAADFKTQNSIRSNINGELEEIAADGELKHATVTEADTFTWKLGTFGKVLGITRKDIINDDLAAFSDTAAAFGRMARRSLSDLFWQTILSNGGNYFSTGHKNLFTGSDSVLSATSLATVIGKMRAQRGANNIDLDIQPLVLVVPPELEQTAKAILESDLLQLASTASGPTGNTLKNALSLLVEPRISNDKRFTGASATQWYVFAGPADNAVTVGFLDGQQTPTVEFFGMDVNPNQLAVQWRVYHDYGVGLSDYRAAQKSAGA